jgi:hypothetical protein
MTRYIWHCKRYSNKQILSFIKINFRFVDNVLFVGALIMIPGNFRWCLKTVCLVEYLGLGLKGQKDRYHSIMRNTIICYLCQILLRWSDEEGWNTRETRSAYGGNDKGTQFSLEILNETDDSEDLGIDERIILKWVLRNNFSWRGLN